MSTGFISSIQIQKLGHKLSEIRIRALNYIDSKLENGSVSQNDLPRCIELLRKLFEWFDFEPVTEEETVFKLILKILKSEEIGELIIKHSGPVALMHDVKALRKKVNENFYKYLDEIIELIECQSALHIDLPLSYRSNGTEPIPKLSVPSFQDRLSVSTVETIRTGVTVADVRQKRNETGSRINISVENQSISPSTDNRSEFLKSLPYIQLNWQPLVKSDCHVLRSVEDSLQNPPQPSILLHSCEFFSNVMLQDFPAEVFIQRPSILTLFYEMIQNCPSTRITNAALMCVCKLTENLITRIRFYSDPCIYNLKQHQQNFETPKVRTSKINSYRLLNVNNEANCDFDLNDDISNQISLPQYCIKTFLCVLTYLSEKPQSFKDDVSKRKTQSGLNTALELVDRLVSLITICIKSNVWDNNNNQNQNDSCLCDIARQVVNILEKIGHVLDQYRLMVIATEMDYFDRLVQLHLLHSASRLLSELVPISKANTILPRSLKNALSTAILDASFGRLYPAAHELLIQFVNVFSGQHESASLTKYRDVQNVCNAMTKAVKMFQYCSKSDPYESLRIIHDSIPSLEFHKNLNLINLFLKLCVKNTVAFSKDERIQQLIEDTLLSFLSHSSEDVRKETYSLCRKLIVNVLGLNHAKHNMTNDSGEPGSQAVFFFRPNILIEIAAHGLTAELIQIQTCAEDILIHILKCKFVVSETIWKKLVHTLLHALPILQCFMDNNTPLGKAIVKILDPDMSETIFIPPIDVLKGNMRMLFSNDRKLRNESISRLCWLLTIEENAGQKLPKIKSLEDCGFGNVFQFEHPIDLGRVRSSQQFYQADSLKQVLELLSSLNVEPSIRRSALTQISVMLEDRFLHTTFYEQNGLKLILNLLENALNENEYYNFPDSVFPVITILKNLCLFNSTLRQELSLNTSLIYNLLRALFLYCTDKRMQQDGALLSCLLLFSEFVFYNDTGREPVGVSLPDIVVRKLNIPFKCHTHWKTSRYAKPSFLDLLSDNWSMSTLRMHWNIEWFGGISELIKWSNIPEHLCEFHPDLNLMPTDLLSLKASSVIHCCQKYLVDLENATSHQSVFGAVRGLTGYVSLWLLANCSGMYVSASPDDALLNLSWSSSFYRFLSAPPANNDEQHLLVEILRFLTVMVKLFKNSGKSCWIIEILQDSSHYLTKLLEIDVSIDCRSISLELLILIAQCSKLEQHLLDINSMVEPVNKHTKARNKNWIYIVQIIAENLKFSDTDQFYNLAYLDKLLSCLVQITSDLGWSKADTYIDTNKLFSELIKVLTELLTAFHYGKGSEAASSFMGLSITRNALLTHNHILYEMQHVLKKNWEMYWINDTVCNATLFSLFSLWSCRDVIVRAATLQLLSGLVSSPRGATLIVQNVRQKHGGIWETTLIILMDHGEASVVREHAAVLLTNLCSHVNVSGCTQVSLPLCHAPLSSNQTQSGIETVLVLLKEYNFFEELNTMLTCLYLDNDFIPTVPLIMKKKSEQILTGIHLARSYIATSESANSNTTTAAATENEATVFITPSLVKSVANFMSNLLFLSPEQISEILSRNGIIRNFFRCLSAPILPVIDNRELLLYTDTLEMCSAVCSLLTRSILVNESCRTIILHTRDCLHVLISLLNPDLYNIHLPQLLYLRNQLWSHIFRCISALLLDSKLEKSGDPIRENYEIITSLLFECGCESFVKTLYESIECNTMNLQKSALQSLTSLLTAESCTNLPKTSSSSFSIQSLLDETKTPRSMNFENNENINPIQNEQEENITSKRTLRTLADSYQNVIIQQQEQFPKKKIRSGGSRISVNIMVGTDLCGVLLRLYQARNLEKNCMDNKKKMIVISALSMLLLVSTEAKQCALQDGLMSVVVTHLKTLHVECSLYSVESLRKASEKKKIIPLLKEVDNLFGLITNFIRDEEIIKNAASNLDLADLIHKYWQWFCLIERSMLVNILKLICTFTTNCQQACQSMTLTNPAAGSGPRKVSTNDSLLNALINLVIKEMDLVSRSHDMSILQLTFHALQNVCIVLECRTILAKSNLFACLNRLHPAMTKRQRPWDIVESLWLEFLQTFTFYAEGQVHMIKSNDMLELILTLASTSKSANKSIALNVLRNVAFHQSNRIKLLASVEFIQLLHTKLTSGTFEDRNIVVSIIWALVANNQRSKIIMKCAGLDSCIHDLLKQYELQGITDEKSYKTMLCVSNMLKDEKR